MQGTNTMRNAPPRPTAYRLRLPGPTAVPERVHQASAQQPGNQRGIEVRQDDWHVDILLTASQKALMCPPGIGLVSVGAKAWPVVERADRVPRFFWDFPKAKVAIDKSETAFTPPLSLIAGLREALRMIDEEGLANVHARHRRLAAALRAGGAALGLDIFTAPSARRSDTVSVFRVPEGLEGGAIVRHLYEHHHTVIAGARNRLAGRVIRIGTMG